METTLRGRVALITGGAGGLGKATAEALAQAGAAVAVVDLNAEEVGKVVAGLRETGAQALAVGADVADAAQVNRVVETVLAELGRIDFTINNAGIDHVLPLTEMSVEQFDQVLSVNLRAAFLFAKAVFPIMQSQGGGHFVNVASTAAKRAWANATAYHSSKWGLIGFTRGLGVEGRPYRIKATAVVPGGMQTHFFDRLDPPPDLSTLQDPANVARVILFVLSQPPESVVQEVIVTPLTESSWP